MSKYSYNTDGLLRKEWDDTTSTYTEWDDSGAIVVTRPYTAEESAEAGVEATATEYANNKSEVEINLEQDLAAMQAVIDQENSALRDDPSQEIKDTARAVRRLIRMALDDFSGTE